ncbi:hypothetical protein MTO96_011857 [Rhipicephalus appendiculatus]
MQQEKSPRSAAEKNTASAGSPRGSPAAAAVAPQRRANGGRAGAPLAATPVWGQGAQATPPSRQRSASRRGREHATRLAVAAAFTLHSPVPTTTSTSLHSSLCTVGAGGRTPCSAVAIVAGGRCLLQPNMLPFETPSIFDQLPRFVFKMPRVVPDQKAKFESDELFRRLSRECEIRYTGYRETGHWRNVRCASRTLAGRDTPKWGHVFPITASVGNRTELVRREASSVANRIPIGLLPSRTAARWGPYAPSFSPQVKPADTGDPAAITASAITRRTL